jgi:hypothetical protein
LDHVRERYQTSHHVTATDALLHERELKRYLLLCAEHPDLSLPVSRVVDELWHEFVLHTRDYLAFCNGVKSGFIHHVPTAPSDSRADAASRYAALLDMYEQEFHEPPPLDVWPRSVANEITRADCSSDVEVYDCSSEGEPTAAPIARPVSESAFADCRAESPPPDD